MREVKQPGSATVTVSYVSAALLNAALYAAAWGRPWLFRTALRSRRVIAQATGILMRQQAGSREDAYGWLAVSAERDHKTILQVAAAVVANAPC